MATIVALAAAGVLGFAAPFQTEIIVVALLSIVLLLAVAVLPVWVLAPTTLFVVIAGALLREQWLNSGSSLGGFIGQGKLIAALGLIALLRLLISEGSLRLPRSVVLVLIFYVGTVFLSATVAVFRGTADPALFPDIRTHLSFMAAFAVGLIAMQNPAHRVHIARTLGVLTIIASMLSVMYWAWLAGHFDPPGPLLQLFETKLEYKGTGQFRADFPFPVGTNMAATVFVMLGVITAPVMLRSGRSIDLILAALVVIGISAAVLTTQSRTGLVMLAIGIGSFAIWMRGLSQAARVGLITTVVVAGALVLVIYGLFPDTRDFSDTSTLESRQLIWGEAWEDFADQPLLGNGFGYSGDGRYGAGQSIHNEYLGQLVDGGVVGGAAIAGLLIVFGSIAWVVARRPGVEAGMGMALLAFIIVLSVSMLTLTPWRLSVPLVLAWLVFGLIAGEYARLDEKPTGRPTGARQPGARGAH